MAVALAVMIFVKPELSTSIIDLKSSILLSAKSKNGNPEHGIWMSAKLKGIALSSDQKCNVVCVAVSPEVGKEKIRCDRGQIGRKARPKTVILQLNKKRLIWSDNHVSL